MVATDRNALLERAAALRGAEPSDFVRTPYPPDAEAETLKVITDLDLRRELLAARLAAMVQSPKGPLQRPYIIRLYPGGDAPVRVPANGTARLPEPARTFPARPTVEELRALVDRIRAVEETLRAERLAEIDTQIENARHNLGELRGDALHARIRELAALLDRRDDAGNAIREEAFRAIESDAAFPARRYLNLLSREA